MLQFLLPASLGEFKSTEQANACELLFKSQMHSLIVLGTGAGKSLLYQLYAMLYHKASQQVTILVVPFVALLADALREAQEKKVPSMIWRNLNTTIDANCALLIVSADLAIGTTFRQSMQQLKSDGNLAGIFIDEMHVPLVYKDLRTRLASQICSLQNIHSRMVFLTATLPLSMEEQALAMYGIRKQAVAISCAASTSRNRTKYSVVSNSIAGHKKQLIQFVNALRRARSKLVLIYC